MNHLHPFEQSSLPRKTTTPSHTKSAGQSASSNGNGNGNAPARRSPGRARSRTASPPGNKLFVVDTNVLLHDPGCIQRFGDNHVSIPVDVLAELDRFKNEQSDRGANARAVHRALTRCFDQTTGNVTEGIRTEGGGTLRLVLFDFPEGARTPAWASRFRRIFPDAQRIDHRIIACALQLQKESSHPVTLVSKDLNMQLKARAVGLPCEDYLNDKVEAADVSSYELLRVDVTSNELQRFASSRSLELDAARTDNLLVNQYVLLTNGDKKTMPARYCRKQGFRRLLLPKTLSIPGGAGIRPINLGQQCFMDALLDPDISLVTCYGHAGTGKTLLAVAAGLHSVFTNSFRGLTISRPVVAMGDTLGFLPGSLEEKMRPWVQPIYDAFDFVMPPAAVFSHSANGKKRAQRKKPQEMAGPAAKNHNHGQRPAKPYDALIESGVVEIEALCHIRGRSIPHRYFILDEAQQLTPLEAKTVVTRMSKSSKLILVGDPAQIDNPYVDSRSNGLVYTRDRLKDQDVSAHVSLNKGERSELAELGATLM